MESDATVPPEQDLTEALLSLSWPLPRTVEDADAALTRLEEVRAVLTRLEQQSVGSEAWWAGPVDALATQSGFVLEWWRPVLRDPELEWTLNHQAHLTADLATLASAGARLLDQMEPRAAEEAAAVHARRAARERRWGPSAVPPFSAAAAGANAPSTRPQPPSALFGEDAVGAGRQQAPQQAPQPQQPQQQQQQQVLPVAPAAEDLEPPQFPPLPTDPRATEPPAPDALNAGAARHRRPSYDFDDPDAPAPLPVLPVPAAPAQAGAAPAPAQQPAALPQSGIPPCGPVPGGVPGPRGPLQQAAYPPTPLASPPGPAGPGYARGPVHGYPDEPDEDEPHSLVPTGLRRHQRRLLMQTAAILVAIAVLCWWAVYTLSSSPSHPAASSTHTTGESTAQGGVGGLGTTGAHTSAAPSSSAPATTQSPKSPTTSPAPAPSTATSTVADGTTVSSVQVTLLGGSATVPQIVALITVHTAGTGPINVVGAYYGAKGSEKVTPETDHWTFSGHTSYQYSVPIANSPYCGSTFYFTLSAGGVTDSGSTYPGC